MSSGDVRSEKNYGEPFQHDVKFKGPLGKRSCTDILCLLIFIVFVACWLGVGIYAMTHGNIDELINPRDSDGRLCGKDPGVRDKKYLLYSDLTKCAVPGVPLTGCPTAKICVEQCPKTTFRYESDKTRSLNELRSMLYCSVDKDTLRTKADIDSAVANDRCVQWYLESAPIFNRCLYNVLPKNQKFLSEVSTNNKQLKYIQDTIKVIVSWLVLSIQNIISHFTDDPKIEQAGHKFVEEIARSTFAITITLIIATVTCIIYIILMQWVASVMVWISICGVIAALSFCTYLCATNYAKFKDIMEEPTDISEDKTFWLVLLILVSIFLGLSILMIIFLRKRIVIAIALVQEASKAVGSVKSTLLFPIIPWILHIGVLAFAVFAFLYLMSMEPHYKMITACKCEDSDYAYEVNSSCMYSTLKRICKNCGPSCLLDGMNKDLYNSLHAVNVIGFFWVQFFVSGLGEIILASAFATWYWTKNKKDVPFLTLTCSVGRVLRYHLGTVAFGSLIITICRLIRLVVEYIDSKLKKYENGFVKAIMCMFKCCLWCLEKFLRFINRNAYIMCAVHGSNFCTSARDAFNLLMRNIVRVVVLDKVTNFLFFLGKLMITIGTGCLAYYVLTGWETESSDEIYSAVGPITVIMIGTYIICSVFFGVYEMAVDTLFLCFLEDSERNDGTLERPYFMSKNLMKILGKKNKKPEHRR